MNNQVSIIIEKAVEKDYDRLREIFYQARKKDFHWVDQNSFDISDFDHSVEGELIMKASIDGQIAGFISIWEPDNFIHNLFVAPEYRRYGVGKALIDEAVKLEGKPMSLKCIKENENAVNFYLSQGWRIEKEEMGPEGPYYLMVYDV